jgi:serine phosphatase RsbU (regulator of sigma subunit)
MKQFIRSLIFFIALFGATVVSAQHSGYYIRNYPPKEYGGFNQMWHAVQDKTGLIYFGSTSNIFVYNGSTFDMVPVKAGMATRQLAIDSATGIIYVGAVSEFGYLERDSVNGKIQFHSLTGTLDEKQKQFSDVWKVFVQGGKTYFQSSERIFICEGKKIVDVIEADKKNSFALMFSSNGRLFVRQRNVGLMELKGRTLSLLPGGEQFATMRLLGVLPWSAGENLVLSGDSGFYLMKKQPDASGSVFRSFGQDPFLLSGAPLGCKWVNDSTFAVNSRLGIGFYNRNAQLVEVLDKSSGLGDGSIAELLLDRQKNLWALHNNGMSKICYNSPLLAYSDETGFSGTIEMMIRYNRKLILATTEGLFESQTEPGPFSTALKFQRMEDIPQTEVWHVAEINGDLFVAATDGLFYIRSGKTIRISNRITNRVRFIPEKNEILTLEKGGLTVFSIAGETPVEIKHFDFPGEDLIESGEVILDQNNPAGREVWLVTRLKSLIRFHYSITADAIDAKEYTTSNGLPLVQLFPLIIGDSSYFFSSLDAYRYVPRLDVTDSAACFLPAPDIFEGLYSGKLKPIGVNFDCRLFLQALKYPKSAIFGYSQDKKIITRQIYLFFFSGESEMQFAFCEPNAISWILSNEKIIRCDDSRKMYVDIPYHAVISKVTVAKDSVIFFGSDDTLYVRKEPLPYNLNSITFNFSAAFYDYDQGKQYMYRLDGLDTSWTTSNKLLEKTYSNLYEGTYTFRVIAFNDLGKYSHEAQYTFTILPPWYRTVWAYTLYVILFVGSLYLSIRLGAQRLRKQKERLEVIVAERTAEVVEQKQKIEAQNFELESAYKGIQDSIHYAERIQHAILPVTSEIHNSFPDSFVFFRPRDIVSGDFYWLVKRGNLTWIACVDCTGHGVPGAFMSMIGNTLLNEIVLEKKIEAPNKILDLLHIRVRQALRQDAGGETRDGMDISLCLIDAEKRKLTHAGANRALWIIRNKELIVLPPDKFSIGGDQWDKERHFTTKETDLADGDCIYMSSDGYADQFGGPKGKKFMVKRFQQLLMEIHQQAMNEQGKRIEKTFDEWKSWTDTDGKIKKLEQVDDVLVIGFRINK